MTRFPTLYALLTGDEGSRPPQAEMKTPPDRAAGSGALKGRIMKEITMTTTTLFSKPKAVPPPVLVRVSAEESQLAEWLHRGRAEVFTVTTLVTPAMAKSLLANNPDNRPLLFSGNRSVAAYADAMRRGEWALNGETVVVSSDGELNDGQHRLNAVIAANTAVQMQITFGVERNTRHTLDQGVARTPGHILAMAGEKSANQLATALQFMWALDANESFNARPSTDQLLATLASHGGLRVSVGDTRKLVGEFRLSAGYIAGAHYLAGRHDAFAAAQWLEALTTGLNIQNINSPVSRLRKMYSEHSAKRQPKDRTEQAALYIKGFNMFIRGRTGVFSYRSNGPAPEAFPTAGA